MEFNRLASGELVPLPNKHVDTGMGFERLAMAIQGKIAITTLMYSPLLDELVISAEKYTAGDDIESIAFRVIVDHVRAVSLAFAMDNFLQTTKLDM